jgi:hypothetical protein
MQLSLKVTHYINPDRWLTKNSSKLQAVLAHPAGYAGTLETQED